MELNHIKVFRFLIYLGICIYIALIALPYFDVLWLSEKQMDVLSYLGFGAVINLPNAILWLFVVIWFVSVIGLLGFNSWARMLFTVWLALSIASLLIAGMEVKTELEGFLSYVGNIIDGAILTMAYTSNISSKFKKEK